MAKCVKHANYGFFLLPPLSSSILKPHLQQIVRERFKQNTIKPVLTDHSKIEEKHDLNDKRFLNEGRKYCKMLPLEHSAILST